MEYNNQVVGQYRVRLNFDTSFTGTDILRARLQVGNLTGGSFAFDQPGNEISYGAFANSGDSVVIDSLKYEFSPFDQLRLGLYANGTGLDEVTFGNTINPLDNPARSAISRFARNAIYRTANTSNGFAANLFLTRDISVQASYMAVEQSNPAPGAGLFNGDYAALGQLTFRNIFDVVDLAFTYVNSYNGTAAAPDGSTRAGVPFALGSRLARVDADRPVISNSYGVQTNFKLFDGLQIGGWAGFSTIRAIELGDADVWNYAVTLAFPDLFKRGSLGGVIVGMQPRLTGATPALGAELGRRNDPDVGYHVEAFYRFALNDNIDITPGVVWLTAPNHDADNDDIIFGTIRTTFRF
ncbi:MAG: carbohydrate porin [Cyanobacteria bacterium RM1_2_2]|nr:carbohydrate porin [Cyanobacteria bacterium RM1_2_2]